MGCADAVNEHIQLVAAEIGYFTSILALLQVTLCILLIFILIKYFVLGYTNWICLLDSKICEGILRCLIMDTFLLKFTHT